MNETAYLSILLADSSLSALVGTRIYLDEAPQQSPALTQDSYLIIAHVATSQIEPELDSGSGQERMRLQVDCYASTKAKALILGDHCKRILAPHGYHISRNPGGKDADTKMSFESNDFEFVN